MDISRLHHLASQSAAVRSRARLVPVGGKADKVFPPTYEGGRYATELRRIDGEQVECVLLDSVQSQANRFEAALQEALDRDQIAIPCIRVRFPDEVGRELGSVTSLTAPHRCYDAILRDSAILDSGVLFPKSEIGAALSAARPIDATALFRYCPTVLVFGGWDSTGVRGGMGAKFTRAVSSEIVGISILAGVRTFSRIDPLEIRREVEVVVDGDDRTSWRLAESGEKGAKRPSEILHGNIAPTIDEAGGGVTIEQAEQTWVLSLPALRRYRFPIAGDHDDARDVAARSVLVALALAARALARADGLFLRSRCQLIPLAGEHGLEAVASDGSTEQLDDPTVEEATALLAAAVDAAAATGLEWQRDPVELEAQPRLVELVSRSFALASKSAE